MSDIKQEKETEAVLRKDLASGGLWLQNSFTGTSIRTGIADAYLIRAMQTVINDYFTPDSAGWWHRLGVSWAGMIYRQIETALLEQPREGVTKPQDILKEDFVETINRYFSFSGIGQFRITEGNRFYVIDIKNPFIFNIQVEEPTFFVSLLCGFFDGLFSELSGKSLQTILLSDASDKEKLRFAISTTEIIGELNKLKSQGKCEKEILEAYKNQHIL